MASRIYVGKTGTGKTEQVYEEVIQASLASDGRTGILLIVPEQSTLDAQQALVSKHPRHCISGLEVLSFQRLAHRVGDSLAIAGTATVSDVGRHMLIRRIIDTSKDSFPFLSRYVHKQGYIEELSRLLSEFSRYNLSDMDFHGLTQGMEQSVLKMKLIDLGTLYQRFKEETTDKYLSAETLMDKLVARCRDIELLQNVSIYIDGFYGFTPIQYTLIERLAETVNNITVTVTMPWNLKDASDLDESHLYKESHLTFNRLRTILTQDPSVDFQIRRFDDSGTDKTKDHLIGSLYQYPYRVYSEPVKGISINRCKSVRQEMDYLRDSILKLVRERGYRYKDITVLSGAPALYRKNLERCFKKAGIPYYLDQKKGAAANEGVAFVLGLVNMYARNMDYSSVFRCLKSDFIDMAPMVLDRMENYAVRYGVRGFKKWESPWLYKVPDIRLKADEGQMVEALRIVNQEKERCLGPIYENRIKGIRPLGAYIRSLYALLMAYGFGEKLEEKARAFHESQAFEKYREYKQIYKKTLDLLDQLDEMSGDIEVDYKTFYELLESGFGTMELGLVPANVDQVIIGDLTRSRISTRKAVFVIGVNEGIVPSLKEGAGLLTDEERRALEDLGMALAPTAQTGLFREQFYIYMAMLRYSSRLFLSYTTTDEDGKGVRPSHLLTMISKILPKVPVYEIDRLYQKKDHVSTAEVAYDTYLSDLCFGKKADGTAGKWLRSHQPWAGRLERALMARREDFVPKQLASDVSKSLYGLKINNSVSRLERFSACPFDHFMTYGLEATERESFEITLPHLGMVFHRVIELFSKRLMHREMDWQDVTDELRSRWVKELISEVLADETYQVFFENSRNRHRILRLEKMIDRALWAISWQICQGHFRPLDAEWRFDGEAHPLSSISYDLGNGGKMSLRGTIDRVDHHRIGNMDYITVVDYKSSVHDFDLNDLYAGLQLQLVVYLNAACEVKEEVYGQAEPAGIFYFKIDDPFVVSQKYLAPEERDAEVLSKLTMKGLVVDDPQIIQALDAHFSTKSKVIPVARKKDGTYTKASKTIEAEALKMIRDYTAEKVAAIGEDIMEGHIEAEPFKKGSSTACDYCAYGSVCQFDGKNPVWKYRVIPEEGDEDVLGKIKEHLDKGTSV